MSEGTDQIPASRFSGETSDDDGNPLFSTDNTGADGPFGAAIARWVTAGIANSDFFASPPAADSEINTEDNALPWWPLTRVSGTSIHAYSVTDTASASGRVIRLDMAEGAAGDDVDLEQIVQVNGARGQSWVYAPTATFLTGPTVSNAQMYTSSQYLKADRTTTTGTVGTGTATTTSVGANTLRDIQSIPNGGAIPSDALYLRIRIGYKRNTAATTTTETVTLTEARLAWGGTQVLLVEAASPATYGYATIYQNTGAVWIAANQGGASGFTPSLTLDGGVGPVYIRSADSKHLVLSSGDGTQAAGIQMSERTDPSGMPTNTATLYARDNGAGKTQLVVVFNTGAVQVLATQP